MLKFSLESPLPFDESAGFTAPSAFGTYRVLHQIGSGVLGPVFRTFDPQNDRLVAVKAFRLEILPEQVARLADALRRLTTGPLAHHPGIVPVFDAGFEGTTTYLAGEYVKAETLDVALRHVAPAPLEQALPVIGQIAAAIDAAWTAGVGHGALHPRDIFVTGEGQAVRLTGAGVVHAIESVGAKAPSRRPYTAPERINGEVWDLRADVYTLGAIAHELLTRRRPAGSGEQDGALAGETTPAQRVQIRRVLSCALAERPANRFATARAFADALAAIGRGELPPGALESELPRETDAGARSINVSGAALAAEAADAAATPLACAFGASAASAPIGDSPADLVGAPQARAAAAEAAELVTEVELEQTVPEAAEFVPADPLRAQHPVLSSGLLNPPETETPGSAFPWAVLAAVAAAGIAVGVVIGYQMGRHVARPAAITAQTTPTTGSAQTDVPVPPEPVAAAEPAPKPSQVPASASKTSDASSRETAPESPGPPAAAPARRAGAPAGRLVIHSTPPGALVVVDGKPRGETPVTLTDLAPGRHTIDVARSGFVPHRETAVLTAGDLSRTVEIRLEAGLPMPGGGAPGAPSAPAPTTAAGAIFVDSRPQAARVMIDGRFAGTTPLRVPDVRRGNHIVRIERTGYNAFSQTVDVQAGGQARVTAALEERQEQ